MGAYSSVDGVTKTKMEEMLRTWRHGGVGGTELFGHEVRESIEVGIFGKSAATGYSHHFSHYGGYPGHHVPTPPPSQHIDPFEQQKSKVMSLLTTTLQRKRLALADNPGDAEVRVHIGVLEQVRHHTFTRLLPISNFDLSGSFRFRICSPLAKCLLKNCMRFRLSWT